MSKRLRSLVLLAVMVILVSASDQPENKSEKPPETKAAYKLFAHAVVAKEAGNDLGALRIMEAAHGLAPKDPTTPASSRSGGPPGPPNPQRRQQRPESRIPNKQE
jgi:hypothetical protein